MNEGVLDLRASKTLVPLSALAILFGLTDFAKATDDCPSDVTIEISSIGYSGQFNVDLRLGTRPGSQFIDSTTMSDSGTYTFHSVCPGTYFFSVGPADSDYVSVTSYFDVHFDGETYNNPAISIFYTSDPNSSGNEVGNAAKSDL